MKSHLTTPKVRIPELRDSVLYERESYNPVLLLMTYDAFKKSSGVAYLLCLFLGMFSAHRFYVERKWYGIILAAPFVLGLLSGYINFDMVLMLWNAPLQNVFSVYGLIQLYLVIAFSCLLWDLSAIPEWVADCNTSLISEVYGFHVRHIEAMEDMNRKRESIMEQEDTVSPTENGNESNGPTRTEPK